MSWTEIGRRMRRSLLELSRARGYALTSVVTLALGVAGIAGFVALYEGVELATSTFDRDGLVYKAGARTSGVNVGGLAPAQLQSLDQLQELGALGVGDRAPSPANITVRDAVFTASTIATNERYLELVAGRPAFGSFASANDRDGVVITDAFWRKAFAGSAEALNAAIRVNGLTKHVVGILPQNVPLHGADVVLPIPPGVLSSGSWAGSFDVIFRAKPGEAVHGVEALIRGNLQSLDTTLPGSATEEPTIYGIQRLRDAVSRASGGTDAVRTLGLCALLLLVLAVVNLSNLALLRAGSRSQEMAVRVALGANRVQLLWATATEGLLVGAAGAVLGILVAGAFVAGLRRVGAAAWPWMEGVRAFSPAGLACAVALALLIPLVVSATALRLSGSDNIRGLMGAGTRSGASRLQNAIGRALVIVQLGMATLLLTVAFLFGHSLWKAMHVDYGVDLDKTVSFAVYPDRTSFPDATSVKRLADGIEQQLSSEPGITNVGYATDLPGSTAHRYSALLGPQGRSLRASMLVMASPGYLVSLGLGTVKIPPSAALVSSSFATRWFPAGAVGESVTIPYSLVDKTIPNQSIQISGVSPDSRFAGALQEAPKTVWLPFDQTTSKLYDIIRGTNYIYFVFHRQDSIEHARQSVERAIRRAAPSLTFAEFREVRDYYADELNGRRMTSLLITAFSGLAVVMAMVGLYSVMSVSVQTRTHEFGVRAALGATRRDVLNGALAEAGVQVLWGCGFGILAALLCSGITQHYLFGVSSVDPFALGGVVLVLAATGLCAAIIPALRAANVHPVEALRTVG